MRSLDRLPLSLVIFRLGGNRVCTLYTLRRWDIQVYADYMMRVVKGL